MDFTQVIKDLNSIAVASISDSGLLLKANAGFYRLINQLPIDNVEAKKFYVDCFFIQPDFASLNQNQTGATGIIHKGLVTIGENNGQVRTIKAHIWRQDKQLHLLAEYDIDYLEKLSDTILKLNQDYAKSQFEITQVNFKLKQREQALEQANAELKATNIRLQTTQKQLVESEKMAAMGVMVAGVAHEINTPLGVSLGSASLLAEQSKILAQRFSERSMTQSDLDGFLNKALPASELIFSNLERIAHLTDSFRKIAVEDKLITTSRFNFKQCLDDVVISLNDLLLAKRATVNVSCDPALEIDSCVIDWMSILTNLITNSLHHGFRECEQGSIDITISHTLKTLALDYRDDGIGFNEEVKTHMFDPFFTTDLQHGMGLGMYLIYNLITKKMLGNISNESSGGLGAHFYIELPL